MEIKTTTDLAVQRAEASTMLVNLFERAATGGIGFTKRFCVIVRDELAWKWFTARGVMEKTGYNIYKAVPMIFGNPNNAPEGMINFFNEFLEMRGNDRARKFLDAMLDFNLYVPMADGAAEGQQKKIQKKMNRREPKAKREPKTKREPKRRKQTAKEYEKQLRELSDEAVQRVNESFSRPKTNGEVKKPLHLHQEKTKATFDIQLPLSEMINAAVVDYIENESGAMAHIEQRIKEEAQKLQPHIIHVNKVELGTIKGTKHHFFEQALKLTVLEHQLYVAGPAGTGKTTMAAQIAEALKLSFAHISCTAGMSEAHLLGRMLADGSYCGSEFVRTYENGGVFLFDEVDAADPNTLLIINSALSNGAMSVPNRRDKQIAKRHKDFYAVCAANTWGVGSVEYAGRNILDAAFLDRFAGSKLLIDYDEALELTLVNGNTNIFTAIKKIRDNVTAAKIRRVVSTRAFVSAARQTGSGSTLKQFVDVFMTGWTTEEKQKAIANVTF